MRCKNVVSVGIGFKCGKPAIIVHVTKKLRRSELHESDIIASTVQGYPTDVIDLGGGIVPLGH